MVASESGRGVDGMDARGEVGCVSPNGSDGKRDIVADSMPVLRDGAIVVANVFDGAKGTPLNGRRSMFSSRMARKRSFAADACTPDLRGQKEAIGIVVSTHIHTYMHMHICHMRNRGIHKVVSSPETLRSPLDTWHRLQRGSAV